METFFFIISYFTCATTLIGVFQIYWIYFRSGKRKIQGCNTCRLLELWWERELEMRKLVQIWNWCTDAKHVNRVQSLIFLIFPTDFVNFLRRKNTVLPRLVNVKNGDNFQKDFPTRLRWQKPVLESDAHLGCPPLPELDGTEDRFPLFDDNDNYNEDDHEGTVGEERNYN